MSKTTATLLSIIRAQNRLANKIETSGRDLLHSYFTLTYVPELYFYQPICPYDVNPHACIDDRTNCQCFIEQKEQETTNDLILQGIKKQLKEVILKYQEWYSISLSLIRKYMPERTAEFIKYYENDESYYEELCVMYCLSLKYVQKMGDNYLKDKDENSDLYENETEITKKYENLIQDTFTDTFSKQRNIAQCIPKVALVKEQDENKIYSASKQRADSGLTDIQEAQTKIDKSQQKFGIERKSFQALIIDSELIQRCEDLLFAEGHYDRVIREACLILENRVRNATVGHEQITGKPLTGTQLMEVAFSAKNAILRFSNIENEQRGAMDLYRGTIAFFRNDAVHNLIDTYTQDDAFHFVAWIDLLLAMLKTVSGNTNETVSGTS